ncbi:imidazolonepropionase [Ideonella sp. DXS29W]|uniref:Imidazolonepropionase n=1 Tax=Ideonella lacteola TaxID=2984193 RepID=A0ABU9BJR5_9BURK
MTHAPSTPTPSTGWHWWRHAKLATMSDEPGSPAWGWCPQGDLLTHGDRIVWVGASEQAEAALQAHLPADERNLLGSTDLHGLLVTPGLIDAHTHLVYGGLRANEFEMRLKGATYEEIARAGGGIRSTVTATRAATEDELVASALGRARTLVADGVTTMEIKSGYGLSFEHEARCLRAARRVGDTLGLTVRVTGLAAHALPPEFDGRADAYIDAICDWLPRWHADGLLDAVDGFCENIGFSAAQMERVFRAAQALGLPVKLHAEQLSDQGGAALAARFNALSADHLEYLSDAGIAAMAAAGTVAMLLPGAYYYLRETKLPPIAALRAAGVPMAIATDHNPGTSPTLSLSLMLNMACTLFRLTPEEALAGATRHAATALGLGASHGQLRAGFRADFALWEVGHPNELAYRFGDRACRGTVIGGRRFSS